MLTIVSCSTHYITQENWLTRYVTPAWPRPAPDFRFTHERLSSSHWHLIVGLSWQFVGNLELGSLDIMRLKDEQKRLYEMLTIYTKYSLIRTNDIKKYVHTSNDIPLTPWVARGYINNRALPQACHSWVFKQEVHTYQDHEKADE